MGSEKATNGPSSDVRPSSSVNVFGVREVATADTEDARHAEDIVLSGFTIVADALSPEAVELSRQKLDEVYARQVEEVGGEDRLRLIGDHYTARCLLAYDPHFLDVATNDRVLAIVRILLGEYFSLMLQNGVLNMPSSGVEQNAGSWHRDLNYQHFVTTRPLSVSALFVIDPFSEQTGGTYVLPASHKTEPFPSASYVESHERVVTADAGSVLIFDSMMFHRGGLNTSANVRRAINHMYTLPLVKQQVSFPRLLGGKYSDDPFLARLLGYESEPADDVVQWREQRIRRAAAATSTPA